MNIFTCVKYVLLFTHSVTKGNKLNSLFYFEILNTIMKELSQFIYHWLSFFYVCLIVDGTTVQTEEMNSKVSYQVKSKPLWHHGFWKNTTRGEVDFPEVGQPTLKNHDGLSMKCLVFSFVPELYERLIVFLSGLVNVSFWDTHFKQTVHKMKLTIITRLSAWITTSCLSKQ